MKDNTSPIYFRRVAQLPTYNKAANNKARSEEILDAIDEFVKDNVQAYGEPGVEGTVIIDMYIDKEGKLQDAKIIKSVSEALDESAIELVKSLEQFKIPAMKKGRAVNCKLKLPIYFSGF